MIVRIITLLAVAPFFMATACSTLTTSSQNLAVPDGQAQDSQSKQAEITRPKPERPKIALTKDILYKIIVAELAGHRGHLGISVMNYLDLALMTRDPKLVERATRIAIYARQEEAAARAAALWIELDPNNPDAHQVLAVMALRHGRMEETLTHLQSILDNSEGDINKKLWMVVNLLGREKDKDLVMNVMEKLLVEHQHEAEAVYAFANIAARMNELDRSLELLERTLELDSDNDNAAVSYITILQRQGRINDAINWVEQTLSKRNTNDFNLRMGYARLLTDVQRFDDARRQFELLSVAAPNNTDVLFALGLLYLQANRLEDSERHFKRLLAQNDRFSNAKYYLGRIAEEQKDYATASTWYLSAQDGENYFDAQIRYSLLKARQGDVEGARLHLQAIRTKTSKEKTMLIQAEGELLIEEKNYEEAMAVFDKALEDTDYNADLLYSRAMLAEKMDRLDILEQDLRTILAKEPEHSQALNALGYTLADRTNRYQEALELIQRALAQTPSDFYVLDSMGWVLYRLGRHEEAIDYLRKAIAIRQDPEIAAHLGEVLWVMGDKQGAKEVWETALQITPEDSRLIDVMRRFNTK